MNRKKINLLTYLLFLTFLVLGCGTIRIGKGSFGYDMKGVQIPPECKTANVLYFANRASLVQPMLAQNITEKLRDKILSDTPLKLTNATGDVNFEGTITSYSTQPVAPQAGANIIAALNRLTITVQVKYNNSKEPQRDYDAQFSRYIDYPSDQSLDQVERSSKDYETMIDLLVQDIFTKAFVYW